MTHVMLDLETMGTGPDAAIVAIGAVQVNAPGMVETAFYRTIDLRSAVAHGGVMDADTVLWWLQQSADARTELCRPGVAMEDALNDFSAWLAPQDRPCIWGNGAAFDNLILSTAYRRAGLPVPWHYRQDWCYRTLAALHPEIPLRPPGIAHNALHDALAQAVHLRALLESRARPVT